MTVNITTNSCVQLKFTQHISSVLNYNRPSVLNHHHLITNSQQLYKAKSISNSFNQERSILRNYRKLWRTVIHVNWITIPCLPYPHPPPPLQQMIYALFYVQVLRLKSIRPTESMSCSNTHQMNTTRKSRNSRPAAPKNRLFASILGSTSSPTCLSIVRYWPMQLN